MGGPETRFDLLTIYLRPTKYRDSIIEEPLIVSGDDVSSLMIITRATAKMTGNEPPK